jgi:hypothetical protein
MIDWMGLAANSLWILGLAVALAALSYASWQAWQNKEKLRLRLASRGAQLAFNLAGVLFCAGLAAASQSWWQILLWAILGLLFLAQLLLSLRKPA